MSGPQTGREVQGLAFLTLISFVTAFLAARTFTILFPSSVLVSGGIHFHHFWWGLAMITGAGWLSIVSNHPEYDRIYAIVFGLGTGLVGDEVGLLLTFGNYQSALTYEFFVAVLSFSGIVYLFIRYRERLEHSVLSLGIGERTLHTGIFMAGISVIAFSFNRYDVGFVVFLIGLALAVTGWIIHRPKRRSDDSPARGPPQLAYLLRNSLGRSEGSLHGRCRFNTGMHIYKL